MKNSFLQILFIIKKKMVQKCRKNFDIM